jgi:hypothetical protein
VLALELLDKVGDQAVAAGRSRRQESKKQLASDHDGKYWEAVLATTQGKHRREGCSAAR